jgi:hypothetical protein
MGASGSSTSSTTNNDIMTKAINGCGSITASNSANFKNVTVSPPEWCGPSATFTVEQGAVVDANCVIDAASKALVDNIVNGSADAKAGLGFSGSSTRQNISSDVKHIMESKCTDIKNINDIRLQNFVIKACNARIVQAANAQSLCQLKALQDLSVETSSTAGSTSSGWDPLSFLNNTTALIICAVISCIVLGIFVVIAYLRSKGSSGLTPSSSNSVEI